MFTLSPSTHKADIRAIDSSNPLPRMILPWTAANFPPKPPKEGERFRCVLRIHPPKGAHVFVLTWTMVDHGAGIYVCSSRVACPKSTRCKVVSRVRANYAEAFHTAHLEVPGEMFRLAMEAQNKVLVRDRHGRERGRKKRDMHLLLAFFLLLVEVFSNFTHCLFLVIVDGAEAASSPCSQTLSGRRLFFFSSFVVFLLLSSVCAFFVFFFCKPLLIACGKRSDPHTIPQDRIDQVLCRRISV